MEERGKDESEESKKPEKAAGPWPGGAPDSLKQRVNSMQWELGMLGTFMFYVVIVFVELALDDPQVTRHLAQPKPRFPSTVLS
jgi:hypothetical protein